MLRNIAAGLFEHGSIETTLPKAKAVQPFIEKLITLAKDGSFTARRRIESRINDRKIHAWVADSNVPDSRKTNDYFDLPAESEIEFNRYGDLRKAPRLVQHLITQVAPRFSDRDGGYTRIIRTGRNRLGDGADIVIIQLVGEESGSQRGGGTSVRRKRADRRTAFAASLKSATAVEVAEEEIVETPETPETPEAAEAVDEGVEKGGEESSDATP